MDHGRHIRRTTRLAEVTRTLGAKKRVLATSVAALALTCTLAGCSGGPSATSPTTSTTTSTTVAGTVTTTTTAATSNANLARCGARDPFAPAPNSPPWWAHPVTAERLGPQRAERASSGDGGPTVASGRRIPGPSTGPAAPSPVGAGRTAHSATPSPSTTGSQ